MTRESHVAGDLHVTRACLTQRGHIAVVANQLSAVGFTIKGLRDELNPRLEEGSPLPCNFVVNGLFVSALTGLQAVHDAIATYCNTYAPDDDITELFYFSTYPFNSARYNYVQKIKRDLYALEFDGRNINHLANDCKHTLPWVGIVQTNNADGTNDVFSGDVGLLRDVVVKAYEITKTLVCRLGHEASQPITLPNV